jgi:alanine-glyoxylate transaminase/serine-glyoxylate transaminase/serine-pyruvate transaminase
MSGQNRLKLMIPGPIQPEDDVLQEMGAPVQAHYGSHWTKIYNKTCDLLKRVYKTDGDIYIMVGSGSAGLDASLGSVVPSGGKVLIGVNGFFGERLKIIAEHYGMEVIPVRSELGEQLSPKQIETALNAHPDASAVAIVHLETSTTVVNPIKAIGEIVQSHKAAFIVDAVSSLGGIPIEMDNWGIDLCISASQKCLGAPPGLTTVAVGKYGWDVIDRIPEKAHGWYLNLRVWREYANVWADWHPFPVTMATNNVLALRKSLEGLLIEGIENRMHRYHVLALRLRAGLRRIGMNPYTPDDRLAPVLTAAYGPEGVPTSEIVTYMEQVHQTKIAGGLGEGLKDRIFRIGHMAPTVTETDIDLLIEQLNLFHPDWRKQTSSVS